MQDEYDPFDDETTTRPKHGRLNSEKKAGAKRLLRAMQWVEQPLLFWAGSFPPDTTPKPLRYRPVLQEFALQLGQKPAGLYTFELTSHEKDPKVVFDTEASHTPRLTDLCAINEDRVLEANQNLVAARRFPIALPPLLPCSLKDWEFRMEGRLRLLGNLVRAGQCLATTRPGSPTSPVADPCRTLAIEEECLWVGPDSLRPSQTTPTLSLRPWLASATDRSQADPLPGARVAAIGLGRRHAGAPLPGDLGAWSACGVRLPSWPADLIVRLARVLGGPRGVLRLAGDLDRDAEAYAPAFLIELLLADPTADAPSLLSGLPLLLAGLGSIREEIQRRHDLLLGSVQQAFHRALMAYPEGDRIPLSLSVVARQFHQDLASTITGVVAKGVEIELGVCASPSKSIAGAARWSLGLDLELPGAEVRPGPTVGAWSSFARETLESLASETRLLLDELPIDHWKSTMAGLAGRICAITSEPETLLHLGEFLESALSTVPPGPDGMGALTTAVRILEHGLWSCGRKPEHLRCFLDLLASDGSGILWGIHMRNADSCSGAAPRPSFANGPPQSSRVLGLIEREADRLKENLPGSQDLSHWFAVRLVEQLPVWPLARLGDLPREQAHRLVRQRWIGQVVPLMLTHPANLPLYADWLERTDPDFWTSAHNRLRWYLLFVNPQTAFISSMVQLVEDLKSTHGLCWAETTGFFPDVIAEWTSGSATPAARTYLQQRLWIVKAIVEAAVRIRTATSEEEPPRELEGILSDLDVILYLAFHWNRNGFKRENHMIRVLLQAAEGEVAAFGKKRDYGWLRDDPESRSPLVDLSAGDPDRLVSLFQHPLLRRRGYEILNALGGLLRRSPAVLRLFLAASGNETATAEIRRLASAWPAMERILAEDEIDSILGTWRCAAGLDDSVETAGDPVEILRRCGLLIADAPALPRTLRAFTDPCIAWRHELEILELLDSENRLPPAAHGRLHNLRDYLAHPDRSRAHSQARLTRWAERRLPTIQLAALHSLLQHHIRTWKDKVGLAAISMNEKDWNNALRLYLLTKRNRRLLMRVMRDRAAGGYRYGRDHPVNRAFLRSMEERSLKMQVWLDPPTWKLPLGSTTLSLYAERDPLKIFQMGNLFGTCLSAGGINSHAVVANAVEINKRVLFLQDSRGRIVGRKLIVLSRRGLLVGYQSYGSGWIETPKSFRPWVKIAFDLYCRDLALEVGARIQPDDEELQHVGEREKDLALFSTWYDDGEEAFDPWIFLRTARGAAPAPEEREPIQAWVEFAAKSEEVVPAQLRALLWLGNAMPRARKLVGNGTWSEEQISILERESVGGKPIPGLPGSGSPSIQASPRQS